MTEDRGRTEIVAGGPAEPVIGAPTLRVPEVQRGAIAKRNQG
ncbi:hypothetical protein [Streptomyces sp. DG1A-41]